MDSISVEPSLERRLGLHDVVDELDEDKKRKEQQLSQKAELEEKEKRMYEQEAAIIEACKLDVDIMQDVVGEVVPDTRERVTLFSAADDDDDDVAADRCDGAGRGSVSGSGGVVVGSSNLSDDDMDLVCDMPHAEDAHISSDEELPSQYMLKADSKSRIFNAAENELHETACTGGCGRRVGLGVSSAELGHSDSVGDVGISLDIDVGGRSYTDGCGIPSSCIEYLDDNDGNGGRADDDDDSEPFANLTTHFTSISKYTFDDDFASALARDSDMEIASQLPSPLIPSPAASCSPKEVVSYQRFGRLNRNLPRSLYFKCHLCGFGCSLKETLLDHFSVAHPT